MRKFGSNYGSIFRPKCTFPFAVMQFHKVQQGMAPLSVTRGNIKPYIESPMQFWRIGIVATTSPSVLYLDLNIVNWEIHMDRKRLYRY